MTFSLWQSLEPRVGLQLLVIILGCRKGGRILCCESVINIEKQMPSSSEGGAMLEGAIAPLTTGNKKCQNRACFAAQSGSSTATVTNTATNTETNSGFTTSIISSSNNITTGSFHSSISYNCAPYENPDAGPTAPQCECDGLDGLYTYLCFISGQSGDNPHGCKTSPTTAAPSSVAFLTTTKSDGEVVP